MGSVGTSRIRAASKAVIGAFGRLPAERLSCAAPRQPAAEAINTLCRYFSSLNNRTVSQTSANDICYLTEGLAGLLKQVAWDRLVGSLQSVEPLQAPHGGWNSRVERCICAPELLLLLFQLAMRVMAMHLVLSDGAFVSDQAVLGSAACTRSRRAPLPTQAPGPNTQSYSGHTDFSPWCNAGAAMW